jgi:1-deoxy-D-xylulose-5-phosphate reductoisomerase
MRLPIALGLAWPERVADAAPGCDWTRASIWQFEPLDDDAFPAVRLARRVGEAGGTLPAVYNAANEECVEAFLTGRLPFLAIVDTVSRVVDEAVAAVVPDGGPGNDLTLDDVLAAESWARGRAGAVLTQGGAR